MSIWNWLHNSRIRAVQHAISTFKTTNISVPLMLIHHCDPELLFIFTEFFFFWKTWQVIHSSSLLLFLQAFLFEALWFLGGWWTGQTEEDLYWVVDEPLEGGQGTNHNDTGSQTFPQTYTQTNKQMTFNGRHTLQVEKLAPKLLSR